MYCNVVVEVPHVTTKTSKRHADVEVPHSSIFRCMVHLFAFLIPPQGHLKKGY